MIKFNKLPPAMPGDVELAKSAEEIFGESRMTIKEATAYGKSIGVTVFSAMKPPHVLLAVDITEPLTEQFDQIIEDPDCRTYFRIALNDGINQQEKVMELTV